MAVPAAKKALSEHLSARRVKLPKVAFSGRTVFTRNLNEAVVETQVLAYGLPPRGPPLAVVRELLNYAVAYLFHGEHFVGRLRYGHGD